MLLKALIIMPLTVVIILNISSVDLKIRSENEDSCVVLNVALRPLYIHQIGDK